MFEQIDTYFQGKLSADDKKAFEERLDTDPAFADDVAFYLASKATLQEQNLRKRHAEWLPNRERSKKVMLYSRMSIGIAASLVLLMFGWLLLKKPELTPEQMAGAYIEEHFDKLLGVSMSDNPTDFEKAKQLAQEGKHTEALKIFDDLIKNDSTDFLSKKMAGVVCVKAGNYDKAIKYFDALGKQQGLQSNAGYFYEALALLKTGQPNNKQQAKNLLNIVIMNNLEGKAEAEKMLEYW
jgi:tetratricopeptide (TPR) repeat protein